MNIGDKIKLVSHDEGSRVVSSSYYNDNCKIGSIGTITKIEDIKVELIRYDGISCTWFIKDIQLVNDNDLIYY